MGEVPADCSDATEQPRGARLPGGTNRSSAARPPGARPLAAEFNFSLFNAATTAASEDPVLSDALDAGLSAAVEPDRWTVGTGGMWCAVTPEEGVSRAQGWKLHVSATPLSAPDVLATALPALLASRSAFKFAATRDHVALLNDRHTSRGHSGKFLTIYPDSDDEAVRLAAVLHEATAGLAGPRVLSDRPYRQGSLVHYRYGAFVEQRRFSHDGFYAWVIEDPDGNPVEDRRVGQYSPPDWVRNPFPSAPAPTGASRTRRQGQGVLIGDRFLAAEAIRHTNRGGVYRATDTETGAKVIVKEARPHVGADRTGRDERDRLRTEAQALEQLGSTGLAPRVVSVFEQCDHLFLAEELVPGTPLREWVPEQIRANGWRREIPHALPMARRVASLLERTHAAGLVVRDFNPNNIMVLPDGELRLIDLELATPSGVDALGHVGTPGFSAPEQLGGAAPDVRADHYSLGATLCFLVIGDAANLVEDSPQGRTAHEAFTEWLTLRWEGSGLPDDLRVLILDLMQEDPALRPSPADARRVLDAGNDEVATATPASPRSETADVQRAIDGIVGHLLDTMTPDAQRLWPMSCAHGAPDPCSVQHGAAGVLAALTRGRALRASDDGRLDTALATAGDWITQRLGNGDGRPPGLYFGEAGIAWALYDAGELLGDERMMAEGRKLAADLPVAATNPDITHGTAGIGLTMLHLWQRTGDHDLLLRASRSADELVANVLDGPDGLSWATPAEAHSKLAGRRYHGFAHGTAGVGYFLTAAAMATGRDDYQDVAVRVGDTLLHNAILVGDVALWGAGTGDGATAPHWCHGSSGIGTFLARLYRATGEERFGTYAGMCARAVVASSSRGVLAQCHGLAGNAEFLLDMYEITGDQSYVEEAARMARYLHSSRTVQSGRVVFPDERGGLTSTWGDGMTGVLSFLVRLRHGTSRMWMVEPSPQGGLR